MQSLKTITLLTFTFSTLLFTSKVCPGQSQTWIGPTVGLHLNHHTFGFRTLDDPTAPFFPAHIDIGGSLGIRLQHHIDSIWSFSGTIAFNNLRGSSQLHVQDPIGSFYLLDSDTFSTFPYTTNGNVFSHNLNVSYTTLSVNLAGQWRPLINSLWSLGIELGPTIHSVLSNNLQQTLDVEQPSTARFNNTMDLPSENNGRRYIFFNGDVRESDPIRLGIKAGLFAEFGNRDSGMVFAPGLSYEFGATTIQKTSNWRVHRIIGELSIMMNL